jgi:hypothetical protein
MFTAPIRLQMAAVFQKSPSMALMILIYRALGSCLRHFSSRRLQLEYTRIFARLPHS